MLQDDAKVQNYLAESILKTAPASRAATPSSALLSEHLIKSTVPRACPDGVEGPQPLGTGGHQPHSTDHQKNLL